MPRDAKSGLSASNKTAVIILGLGDICQNGKLNKHLLKKMLLSKNFSLGIKIIWYLKVRFSILPAFLSKERQICSEINSCENQSTEIVSIAKKVEEDLFNKYKDDKISVFACTACNKGSLSNALNKIEASCASRLIVLPLFPQNCFIIRNSVERIFAKHIKKYSFSRGLTIVPEFSKLYYYHRALAADIKHSGFGEESDDKLLFVYDPIRLSDIEGGDTYEKQVGATTLGIADELGLDRGQWSIAYSSHIEDSQSWLGPRASDIIRIWASSDVQRIFVVYPARLLNSPYTNYNFNYELKRVFKKASRSDRRKSIHLVPALGKTKTSVDLIAELVRPYLN